MDDVAKIAKGLTHGQREAMIVMNDPDGYYGSHECYADGELLSSLIELGLSGDGFPDRMTPPGLAVRAYLQENRDAG
jgi:hypothetical protein